ncbi:hypothetical protein ACFE04_011059 [Oxalis oulophora]
MQILDRGEKIELLVDKTENLQFQADSFQRQGRQLRRKMWLQNLQMKLMIGGAVTFSVNQKEMGNCLAPLESQTRPKFSAEITPFDCCTKTTAVNSTFDDTSVNVSLYGPEDCHVTIYLQHALLYKLTPFRFIICETPAIWIGKDVVSGTREEMLRFIESKFPEPELKKLSSSYHNDSNCFGDDMKPFVLRLACMQHRGMVFLLENMVRWAEDLRTRSGGKWSADPAVGSPRMEVKKFGEFYSCLLEVLLEHAQMEEKVIFPLLTMADPGNVTCSCGPLLRDIVGLCKEAHQEHARDLPIMNGIKEVIKSMAVLQIGSPAYEEALANLATRLISLKEHCTEHFEDEEKNLLPLLEALEHSRDQQKKVLAECVDVMKATHSRLLKSLLLGLTPQDAMQYLDLIRTCNKNGERQSLRGSLRGLLSAPKKEKAPPPSSKPAKSGGGKQKKKKWSKGKQKEKVNNMVLFDAATYEKLLSDLPKAKLVTPSVLSDRLRINGSLARKAIKDLMARGLIRMISSHSSQQIYTRATNT